VVETLLYGIVADPVVGPEIENTYVFGFIPPNLEAVFAADIDTKAVVLFRTMLACPLGVSEPT
jgi:hypothetical protein